MCAKAVDLNAEQKLTHFLNCLASEELVGLHTLYWIIELTFLWVQYFLVWRLPFSDCVRSRSDADEMTFWKEKKKLHINATHALLLQYNMISMHEYIKKISKLKQKCICNIFLCGCDVGAWSRYQDWRRQPMYAQADLTFLSRSASFESDLSWQTNNHFSGIIRMRKTLSFDYILQKWSRLVAGVASFEGFHCTILNFTDSVFKAQY